VEQSSDNYPYPYAIDSEVASFTWTGKSEKEIDETYEDSQNVKYAINNEFNVKISKRDIEFN